jgi:hypothetical protein
MVRPIDGAASLNQAAWLAQAMLSASQLADEDDVRRRNRARGLQEREQESVTRSDETSHVRLRTSEHDSPPPPKKQELPEDDEHPNQRRGEHRIDITI